MLWDRCGNPEREMMKEEDYNLANLATYNFHHLTQNQSSPMLYNRGIKDHILS